MYQLSKCNALDHFNRKERLRVSFRSEFIARRINRVMNMVLSKWMKQRRITIIIKDKAHVLNGFVRSESKKEITPGGTFMKKDRYKRLQFDFSEEAVSRLDEMVEKSEFTSRAELIRRSLQFFEYLSEKKNEGYDIELTKGDNRIALAVL